MTDKEFVLSHYSNAIVDRFDEGGYSIDDGETALNWWNSTEEKAWEAARYYIEHNIDPIKDNQQQWNK